MRYFNKITMLFLCLIATSALAVDFKAGAYIGLVNSSVAGYGVENAQSSASNIDAGYGASFKPLQEFGVGGEVWFGDFAIGLGLGYSSFLENLNFEVTSGSQKVTNKKKNSISGIQINPSIKFKSFKLGIEMMMPSETSFEQEYTYQDFFTSAEKTTTTTTIPSAMLQTYMQVYLGQDISLFSIMDKGDEFRLNWRLGYDLNSPFVKEFYAPSGDLTYMRLGLNLGISYYLDLKKL